MIPLSAPVSAALFTYYVSTPKQVSRRAAKPSTMGSWVGKSVILSGRVSTGVKRDYMCYAAELSDLIVKQGTLISFSSELLVSHIIPLSIN